MMLILAGQLQSYNLTYLLTKLMKNSKI